MVDYEACRTALSELRDWYETNKGNRNEATTRLHLIDKLMFDCLGWATADAVTEDAYDNEYTDYTFSAPRQVLILEAKKEGNYFELPAGASRIERSIPTLCREYPALKDAIVQVAGYCQNRGVPFGAEGWQIGGKTGSGTALLPKGAQIDGWFAGLIFDPQGKARFTVSTFVRSGGYGGDNAAKISADLAGYLIR